MTEIPHFDLPFRFQGGRAVMVEQDSLRDIQNCVEAILRTHVGTRESLPTFGIPDLTFEVMPIDPIAALSHIEEQEPRAVILLEESADAIGQMLDRIKIGVSARAAEESVLQ